MQFDRLPIYQNALEPLVAEEVQQQMRQLPLSLVLYINPAQVVAYALNRLPPLYATSTKGWQLQQKRATTELHSKIEEAVRWGITAVQCDPLRVTTPCPTRSDVNATQSSFATLRNK